MNTDELFIKNHISATKLVREGMRLPLVHAMTGVAWRSLRKIWQDTYGETAPLPGRLPGNTLSYIKYGQTSLLLSTLVAVYLTVEKRANPQTASQAEMFIQTWESRKLFAKSGMAIDINAAWYAIRDVKAGLVSWGRCKQCKATYIFDTGFRETSKCPYCGERDIKIIGPEKQ
jgi:predicted Zn-ribbon and HTH transcriptional regulator